MSNIQANTKPFMFVSVGTGRLAGHVDRLSRALECLTTDPDYTASLLRVEIGILKDMITEEAAPLIESNPFVRQPVGSDDEETE